MAEGIFRHLVEQAGLADRFDIESAGTGGWHVGERPHTGTLAVLKLNQISLETKRARQLSRADMQQFDYVIAMDGENVADIQAITGQRVRRLLDFAPSSAPRDVPDPYYTGSFDLVYRLILLGCQGLLEEIRQKEGL
jgi:protein-tyrosine phosphatase